MITESSRIRLRRPKVTLLVLGQSNEQGPVLLTEQSAYPNAFVSARNPEWRQKRPVPYANRGSWWPKVYDDLWDWGYDLDIINGAIGGASITGNLCGTVNVRANSTRYMVRRAPSNFPDLGDFGDVLQITNGVTRHFVVTAGQARQVFGAPPALPAVGPPGYLDYIAYANTADASGGSAPDVSSVVVGGTITDGTLTLTRVDGALYTTETTFYPGDNGQNGNNPNFNLYGVFGERSAGYGWDPQGIISAAERLAQAADPDGIKIMYLCQGQSDLSIVAVGYQRAVMLLTNFFLRRGWTVVIGNTMYSPASLNSTATNYGYQVTGVDDAIAALLTYYPGKVKRGANLYSALGTTGAMGGQKCTGGTGGVSSTTLTISAVQASSGSGIAVGQSVYNGTTLVGVIQSMGTSVGGTGTVNLAVAATVTNGTSLVCVGSGLQFDGVHHNGSMVSAAGDAVADSLKAFLPQLVA